MVDTRVNGSFRDPSGFIFVRDGVVFRRVNQCYEKDYNGLMSSGLYQQLVKKEMLIAHEHESGEFATEGFIEIKPEQLAFVSYPYEWSFTQLKEAALVTLAIQKQALRKNMSLKDASAYNIQFHQGKPVFIDTLSFETYQEGKPWVAYRQFCQHFLAPLALMAKTDVSLNQLLQTNIDGVPLALASKLLPMSTKLSLGLLLHIHMHAKAQKKNAAKKVGSSQTSSNLNKRSLLALVDSLESCIKKLDWKDENTEWRDYYESNNNYDDQSLQEKQNLIEGFIENESFNVVWDLGANIGRFSRAVASKAKLVCAWDIDPGCVDENYRQVKLKKETNILPLMLDLTAPSASIGWANQERDSLKARGAADLVLALGLVHHLAIANNIPLQGIAEFFASVANRLIIEFVPKGDSQVDKLLQNREDIFDSYTQEYLEDVFSKYFDIKTTSPISGTKRTLYLMIKK